MATRKKKKQNVNTPMTNEEIIEMRKTQPHGLTKAEAPIVGSKKELPRITDKGVVIPGYASPHIMYLADQVDVARAIAWIDRRKHPVIRELFRREPTITDVSLAFIELFANCRATLDDDVVITLSKRGVFEFHYNAHLYVAQPLSLVGPRGIYNSLNITSPSVIDDVYLNSFFDFSGVLNFQYYGKMKSRISSSTHSLERSEHRFSRVDGSFDDVTEGYDALLMADYDTESENSILNEPLQLYLNSLAVSYEQKIVNGRHKLHFAVNDKDEDRRWQLKVRYLDLLNSDGMFSGSDR